MLSHKGEPYTSGVARGIVTRAQTMVDLYGGPDLAQEFVRTWTKAELAAGLDPKQPNQISEDVTHPNGPPSEAADFAELGDPLDAFECQIGFRGEEDLPDFDAEENGTA